MKKLYYLLVYAIIAYTNANAQSCVRFKDSVFTAYSLENVQYGMNTDVNGLPKVLSMDIYQPTPDTMKSRPLFIWAFGGSFTYGDRKSPDIVQLCNYFSKRGYVCASIDYRLGIEGTATQTYNEKTAIEAVIRGTHDGKAAVRFFKKNCDTYKIDTNNIVFGGVSAGGFIALHNSFLNTETEFYKFYSSVDLNKFGGIEGNSGNPGYSSHVKAVINLCGALGQRSWMIDHPEVAVYNMHGDADGTVPYSHDSIFVFGKYITVVDGSHSIDTFANNNPNLNLKSKLYTWHGADHVPFVLGDPNKTRAYMDTVQKFVNNYLYNNIIDTIALCPIINAVKQKQRTPLNVYPNPSKDGYLYISLPTSVNKNYKLLLYNSLGQIVWQDIMNSPTANISTASYPPGIYTLMVEGDNKQYYQKVILQ